MRQACKGKGVSWQTRTVLALLLLALVLPTLAYKVKPQRASLDALVLNKPLLRVVHGATPYNTITSTLPNLKDLDAFVAENGPAWTILLDEKSGRVSLVDGGAIPIIPGNANSLAWEGFDASCRRNDCIPVAKVEGLARQFLWKYQNVFRVNPDELVLDPLGSDPVGNSIYFLRFQWVYKGIEVEGGSVFFRINNGNLIQVATENIGDINLDVTPLLSSAAAWQVLDSYLGSDKVGEKDLILDKGRLGIIQVTPQGVDTDHFGGNFGQEVAYRLVYHLVFQKRGMQGTWEGLVDAQTGEILRFGDINRYGIVHGGIRPSDGLPPEQDRPFPYADIGGGLYSDSAGQFSGNSATSTLVGKYAHMSDACGAISNTTTTGDLDFLTDNAAGTDCVVPPSNPAGAGNTHSSRTLFYNLTAINLKAQIYNPSNAWLTSSYMTANVNGGANCNASSGGGVVNFYKSDSSGCAGGDQWTCCNNLGEIPGVAMHEWAHGFDSNDGSGGQSPPLETYADWTAIIQTHNSCTGAGFFQDGHGWNCEGYGNPCTACTGIRDCDYAKHNPGTPWTSALNGSLYSCSAGSYNGPCGWEDHCESGIAAQAMWDFVYRDLPTECGLDLTTAWMLEDRLWFTGVQTMTAFYTCSSGTTDGCSGTVLYSVMRALDDDGDGTANGTPHAHAIYTALHRHLLDCSTYNGSSPQNQNQTSCPSLNTPTLSGAAGNNQVLLNWTTGGASATRYWVYKNESDCNVAFNRIATVTAPTLTYTDNACTNGVTYYYRVQAVTSNDSCASPSSNCVTLTPQPCTASVALDKTVYPCTSTVNVTVLDSTPGAGPWQGEAWSTSDATHRTFALTGTVPNLTGSFTTTTGAGGSGVVHVANGDTLTVRFVDPDNCGAGSLNVDSTVPIDCVGPIISNVLATNITGMSADITWTTDENSDSSVVYDNATPPSAHNASAGAMVTSHIVHLTGLTECTKYWFYVRSTDLAGNQTTANNGGAYYTFMTGKNNTPTYTKVETPPLAIPDNSATGASSVQTVPDNKAILDVNVMVNISHTFDGDLTLQLIGPDATTVMLSNRRGSSGDNFVNTVFDDEAATPIASGTAPFTGSFIPDAALSAFDGKIAAGTWTLKVVDNASADTGTINDWSLILTYPAETCAISDGTITLDKAVYGPSSTMEIVMKDIDLLGTGSHDVEAFSTTESTSEVVSLTETPANSGEFKGTFPTTPGAPVHGDGYLSVSNGDTITARYIDADDGNGHTNVPKIATATADVAGPIISNVQVTNITPTSARITWTTSESANSRVTYGLSKPPGTNQDDLATYGTTHTIDLSGLTICTTYFFSVTSADIYANGTTDTNGGTYYAFNTLGMSYAMGPDNVESGVGNWVVSGGTTTTWHRDTCKAHSGSYAWKAGVTTCPGVYDNSVDTYLTYGADIALGSTGHGYHLKWYEWYTTESCCDKLTPQISTDGGTSWTDLMTAYSGTSGAWLAKDVDLAAYTGSTVRVRFLFHTDTSITYEGWYLDDLEISKSISCYADPVYQGNTFTDTCATGGAGNNNGIIDAGESITVHPTLKNMGALNATGVSATLSTTTPGITITGATTTYPDLPIGGSAPCNAPYFTFVVGPSVACGTVINFSLAITAATGGGPWTQNFTMTVGSLTYPATTLFSETFDSATWPPTGWTVTDVSGTAGDWARYTTTSHPTGGSPHSGAGMAGFNSYTSSSGSSTRLARTANLSIPAGSATASAVIWMYHDTAYTTDADQVQVQTSPDGTTWTTRGTINRYDGSTGWKQHTVDLSVLIGAGNFQIGYLGVSAYGNDCYMDDVTASYTTASCTMTTCVCSVPSAPAAPTFTGVGQTSITVNWSAVGGATTYDVWRQTGASCTGASKITASPVAGLSYADSTVTCGNTYSYLVTANNTCGTSANGACNTQATSACASVPKPVPDGRLGGTAMKGARVTVDGSSISCTYDTGTCSVPDHSIIYGTLANVSTVTPSGSVCSIANTSPYSWTSVPAGNLWWVIVGDSGTTESSWGQKYVGGSYSERSTSPSNQCGNTVIDTSGTCP